VSAEQVQEITDEGAEPGRIPRTVEVELREDLVDTCIPGDVVRACVRVCVYVCVSCERLIPCYPRPPQTRTHIPKHSYIKLKHTHTTHTRTTHSGDDRGGGQVHARGGSVRQAVLQGRAPPEPVPALHPRQLHRQPPGRREGPLSHTHAHTRTLLSTCTSS
jgi:hypothetical protein